MNGFITESTSKISDGFGSALKLLVLSLFTTLLYAPASQIFGRIGALVYLMLLFAGGVYFLQRALQRQSEKTQQAWQGMTAGVFLWQVIRFSPSVVNFGLFDPTGYVIFLMTTLVTLLLWQKVLPTGVKFFLLVFLLNWVGRLYLNRQSMLAAWPQMPGVIDPFVRYLGAAGIFACLWYIVMRSDNALKRKYCALLLYFCVLLTFLYF